MKKQPTRPMPYVLNVCLLIYTIFEETGWRGYLEDELRNKKELVRVLVVATFWYVGHQSLLKNPDFRSNIKFFGIMMLGNWGIGEWFTQPSPYSPRLAFTLCPMCSRSMRKKSWLVLRKSSGTSEFACLDNCNAILETGPKRCNGNGSRFCKH